MTPGRTPRQHRRDLRTFQRVLVLGWCIASIAALAIGLAIRTLSPAGVVSPPLFSSSPAPAGPISTQQQQEAE